MKSVAVFCGSNVGSDPAYAELATALGTSIAKRGMTLVFGGGNVGLMGTVADAAMNAGGRVTGIIPRDLMDRELGHTGITQLRITGSMHERKAAMEQDAEGFIALPGGFGTLDEFCEILTWAQLDIHRKPCAILDTKDGFYKHLLAFFDTAVDAGFVRQDHRDMIHYDSDPDALLDAMVHDEKVTVSKWIDLKADAVPPQSPPTR